MASNEAVEAGPRWIYAADPCKNIYESKTLKNKSLFVRKPVLLLFNIFG
jgi:hypothetical protein